MKRYKLKLKNQGVFAMSLVKKPAMQEDFIHFAEDNEQTLKLSEDEKMMVTGPALIPNKDVYRRATEHYEESNVFFDEETIEQASIEFMTTNSKDNATLQHSVDTSGVELIESWIVNDPECDKSKSLGFDVPKGTWMISYKVKDENVWNGIKDGEINGFSIEAEVGREIVDFSEDLTDNDIDSFFNDLSEKLK